MEAASGMQSLTNLTPDEAKGILVQLEDANRQRNTVSFSDFQRYLPLYIEELQKQIDTDTYKDLCEEFTELFSLYYPITVLEDGTDEVKMKLPPVFQQCDTLNSVVPNSHNLVNAFSNAMKNADNPINIKPAEMTALISGAIRKSGDPVKEQEAIEEYAHLADALKEGRTPEETSENVSMDEFVWE